MTVAEASERHRKAQDRADGAMVILRALVRQEAANGTSKTLLAEQSGLSRQTIHNILKEGT